MNCAQSEILLHALIDGELDAIHTRDLEAHVAACPDCAGKLVVLRAMREMMAASDLAGKAPSGLRGRIEAALPSPPSRGLLPRGLRPASWRALLGGFALGSALSAAVAASLVLATLGRDQRQMVANEIVSAHLRSLQAGHLTDVETSDEHTVKPWFNGKLNMAPPVVDLAAQGFTLIGGRLDYIGGTPAGSIVYRRRNHVINLFVAQNLDAADKAGVAVAQGFNVRHWTQQGLGLWAVSDINAGELEEFARDVMAALRAAPQSP